MLLGKRPRHPMIKRTVSMTGLTLDPSGGGRAGDSLHPADQERPFALGGSGGLDRTILATVSPRAPHRRNYTDFVVESSSFLRACSLCNRRLVPGRDIYMYRGDSAYCSLECRQQQMNQDEGKNKSKFSVASEKQASSTTSNTTVPSKGESVTGV